MESSKQGKVVTNEVDISADAKQKLRASVDVAISTIASGKFPPTPTKQSCGSCDLSNICVYANEGSK